MNRQLFLLVVPALALAAPAQADFYSHRYAGVSYSDTGLSGFCTGGGKTVQNLNSDEQTARLGNCSETGSGWKIYSGWRWTPYLAVEGSYQRLASGTVAVERTNVQLFPIGFFPEWRERNEISTSLGNVFMVGHWPLFEGFSLFGKLGGGFWNSRIKQRVDAVELRAQPLPEEEVVEGEDDFILIEVPASGTFEDSQNGFHWGYGAGISYRHQNSWTIRAEWEAFSDVGSDDFFSSFDVQSASLGWSMHF
ncbi:outer membrane protein [Microbulbifer sp.]|uniref:outer membrane protein n=1 Tax=Microbulbifer sp. TaxID=1908541 RepID=UPI003F329147